MLSQFRMVVHIKWKMTYNTEAFHKPKNIKDLSYDVMTAQGFECQLVPNTQGLHVYKVILKNQGKMFGSDSGSNKSIFGGSYYVVMESDGT